jgi:hypothetical protein
MKKERKCAKDNNEDRKEETKKERETSRTKRSHYSSHP